MFQGKNALKSEHSFSSTVIQYNTLQYNTEQYSAVQCRVVQCSSALHFTALQCNAIQCNAIRKCSFTITLYVIKQSIFYVLYLHIYPFFVEKFQNKDVAMDMTYDLVCQSDPLRLLRNSKVFSMVYHPISEKQMALILSDSRVILLDVLSTEYTKPEVGYLSEELYFLICF